MDPVTLWGMGSAVLSLVALMVLDGVDPLAVVLVPPLLLVFGGTLGATVAGGTSADIGRIGAWLRLAFSPVPVLRPAGTVDLIVDLAGVARRHGLLELEKRLPAVPDPFLRRALQMVVDGVPAERLRRVLERETEARRREERLAARFFARMGGYAPTIGIIGTVVGLIQVLHQLDDLDALGPMVGAAFVATLWGVLSANVFWLPLSAKILRGSQLRSTTMALAVEGACEIQAGIGPRSLRMRLRSLLPPSEAVAVAV
jgi:chemotaxis protein MotA